MKKLYFVFVLILLVSPIMAQNIPSYVPKDGLVGYWPFNGNANDESGNGNHGTVNGATLTKDRKGETNNAFNFNGIDNFISVPNSNVFNNTSYSISLWFSSNKIEKQVIVVRNNFLNATNEHFGVALNSSNQYDVGLFSKFNNPNCSPGFGWETASKNINILDLEFHHLVGTVNKNVMQLFIDGALVDEQNISGDPSTCWAGDIKFARNWSSNPDYFKGVLDDIAIYNRALSEKEISDLYAGNKDCSYLTTTIIPDGNTTFCVGNYVNLKTEVNSNYTYQWFKNDISINGYTTAEYKVTETGNYHLEVSDQQCKVSSNKTIVKVNPIKECLSKSITYNPGEIVKDYDNNDYETVIIGKQVWMKTNLRTTHFSNGDSIQTIADGTQWYLTTNNSIAAWSPVGGDPSHDKLRGKLYNWYAVNDSRNICPSGYRVPSNNDWDSLVKYLDPNSDLSIVGVQSRIAGAYLKDTLNNLWNWGNIGAANVTGFSARPAGIRGYYGNYYGGGDGIFMWSSTENGQYHAYFRGIDAYSTSISKATTNGIDNKSTGGSIRCMRNLLSDCANIKAYIYVDGQASICSGDSVKLSTNGFGGQGSTQWILDGKPIQGATSSSYTASLPGSYTVRVKVDLCSDISQPKTVQVNPNPIVKIVTIGNTTFCAGGFVNLIAEGGTTYQWNNGSKSSKITVNKPGTYIVNGTNAYGCIASASQIVNVNPFPDVTFSDLSPFILQNSKTVELIASPNGGKFTGEGVEATTFNPSKTKLGKKTVTYTFTTPEGCSNSVFRSTIVVDSSGNVCKITSYDTVTVKNNVFDTVIVTNNVTKYDTVIVTNNVTKYDTVTVNKTIYDTLIVKNNVYDTVVVNKTKYDTITVTNNVTKYDTVTVNKTVYDTLTVKNNVYDTVKFNKYDTITVTNNVTKYDTLKVTKFDTVTVKNNVYDTVTITNNVTKYDTVKVTKFDTVTVKNNVYDTVIVNKYDTITVTNNVTKYDTITLTDTVSILKITFKLTTGIQANQLASMSLYPNPTTDVLHIELGDAKALDGYRYRILDALGKEVYNEFVKNAITEIPLKSLGAAGIYQFEVLDQKNTRIQANKIVLQ